MPNFTVNLHFSINIVIIVIIIIIIIFTINGPNLKNIFDYFNQGMIKVFLIKVIKLIIKAFRNYLHFK